MRRSSNNNNNNGIAILIATILLVVVVDAFVSTTTTTTTNVGKSSSVLSAALVEGDQVMLIGPGFLQLVMSKTCKAAGLRPLIVAPQLKLDNFAQYVEDEGIMKDSTIGMPEVGEDQFGNIAAIVFCAEDAVLPASYIKRVLDYQDLGQSPFTDGKLKKVVMCAPCQSEKKEKSMGWMPIFNNDDKKEKVWNDFVETYSTHPMYKDSDIGSIVRFGTLLGGSTDGPECIQELGISEKMYKMSLEQYRDIRERGFDRFKLGAQLLEGNTVNPRPPNQDKIEKEYFVNDKKEFMETFTVVNGYPEEDRTNRHTVAQVVVQSLLRDDKTYPKELTILSKAASQFPSDNEWNELFDSPGPANWPDPYQFDAEKYAPKK